MRVSVSLFGRPDQRRTRLPAAPRILSAPQGAVRAAVAHHGDVKETSGSTTASRMVRPRNLRRGRSMAKKVTGFVKLQIPAGKANPAPPVGTALGPQGINIMAFCKEFNARTQGGDMVIPVEVTIYARQVVHLHPEDSAGGGAHQEGSWASTRARVSRTRSRWERSPRRSSRRSPTIKMPDLNCDSIESAIAMMAGAARSMGVDGQGLSMQTHGKKYRAASERRDIGVPGTRPARPSISSSR